MATFHFCYDLSVFGFLTFEMNGGFFTWFRFLIVTLFFTSVGAGLFLAHTPKIQWKKFGIRESKLILSALFISVSTFYLYPSSWVWFGVLHFIAVASVIALPFLFFPRLAALLGILFFVLYNLTDWFNLHILWTEFSKPLNLPRGTQDLTRLIPWLGMVLIGVYLGKVKYWRVEKLTLGPFQKPVSFVSKHSLVFYLLHQPPLFGLAWGLDKLIH
jgi:uncharacterized membrane protein